MSGTNESSGLTLRAAFLVERRGRGGRTALREAPDVKVPTGRVPRVSRLMALALRFQTLIAEGVVKDYVELARLGHVTRARMSQIMNLTLLAPDLQEQLLFLPLVEEGRDPIVLRDLQAVATMIDWKKQRKQWSSLSSPRR